VSFYVDNCRRASGGRNTLIRNSVNRTGSGMCAGFHEAEWVGGALVPEEEVVKPTRSTLKDWVLQKTRKKEATSCWKTTSQKGTDLRGRETPATKQ